MRNLKNILQSKFFFAFLFLFTFLFVIYTFLNQKTSFYQEGNITLNGTILDYKIDGNLLSMVIFQKEKIQAFYYISSEKEKEYLEKNIGYGKKVVLSGVLEKPEENRLFHTFSYQKYLTFHHIHYICQIVIW